uniref:TIR domain-containing protein n=1 Tax=Bracon brevicornis TaxID=1563983 RepID=A0A6V7IFS6_9HYME
MKDFTFFRGNTQITYANNQIQTISFAGYETFPMFAKRLELAIGKNPINCDCRIHDFLKFRDSKIQKQPIVLDLQGTYCHEPEDLSSTRIAELDRSILKCLVEVPIGLNAICPEKCQCWKIPENQIYRIDCRYKNLIKAPEHLLSPEGLRIELLLDENRIRKMPLMTRPGYDYVVKLTLSGNMIEDVCLDGLSNNLEILTLDSNRLRNLDPQVLTFLKDSTKLRHLELHGNPWVCNCETVDLLKFIVATSSKFQDLQNVTCESLEYPIFEMMLEDFCPVVAGSIIIVGISIALLGILIGIAAAMYYSYQHEIKVWLYTKQWCLWFVTEDEVDKDKQFDAFVSFSHMDHDLVAGTLVPKLEEDPYHYRLCVHYRNWIPGESIPTQIFNSVENSKRTIIVLSQNFLDSVWSRLEFRTAHEQALSEGRARVIIVLLGDIGPADNLDPELKAYLKLNTYVRWGDPWFWEKLKYALPHSSNLQRRKDWRGVTSHIELNESIL